MTKMTKPMSALAELMLAQAECALGREAGPWALYLYACEVVWDLWRDAGRLPVYVAEGALLQIREEIERREAMRFAAAPLGAAAGGQAAGRRA